MSVTPIGAVATPDGPDEFDDRLVEVPPAGPDGRFAVDDPVRRLSVEIDTARRLVQLQDDPALTDALSPEERAKDRNVTEKIRSRRRDQRKHAGLAGVKRDERRQRAESRLADLELSDQIWHRQALSTRRRLLDPTSRLAQLQRVLRMTSAVLTAVMVIGIAWASVNVQHNVAADLPISDPLYWLSFGLEPLVSLPLVVLLWVRGVATQWGRTFGGRKIVGIELTLLLVGFAMNAGPVAPFMPGWRDWTVFLVHCIPSGMVATSVFLAPIVTGFLANVLVSAYIDAGDLDTGRMSTEAAELVEYVVRIRAAVADGSLKPSDDARWPSISAIQRYLAIAKQKAQAVHDALTRLG